MSNFPILELRHEATGIGESTRWSGVKEIIKWAAEVGVEAV